MAATPDPFSTVSAAGRLPTVELKAFDRIEVLTLADIETDERRGQQGQHVSSLEDMHRAGMVWQIAAVCEYPERRQTRYTFSFDRTAQPTLLSAHAHAHDDDLNRFWLVFQAPGLPVDERIGVCRVKHKGLVIFCPYSGHGITDVVNCVIKSTGEQQVYAIFGGFFSQWMDLRLESHRLSQREVKMLVLGRSTPESVIEEFQRLLGPVVWPSYTGASFAIGDTYNAVKLDHLLRKISLENFVALDRSSFVRQDSAESTNALIQEQPRVSWANLDSLFAPRSRSRTARGQAGLNHTLNRRQTTSVSPHTRIIHERPGVEWANLDSLFAPRSRSRTSHAWKRRQTTSVSPHTRIIPEYHVPPMMSGKFEYMVATRQATDDATRADRHSSSASTESFNCALAKSTAYDLNAAVRQSDRDGYTEQSLSQLIKETNRGLQDPEVRVWNVRVHDADLKEPDQKCLSEGFGHALCSGSDHAFVLRWLSTSPDKVLRGFGHRRAKLQDRDEQPARETQLDQQLHTAQRTPSAPEIPPAAPHRADPAPRSPKTRSEKQLLHAAQLRVQRIGLSTGQIVHQALRRAGPWPPYSTAVVKFPTPCPRRPRVQVLEQLVRSAHPDGDDVVEGAAGSSCSEASAASYGSGTTSLD